MRYFPVVLFIMQNKVVQTLYLCMDKIIKFANKIKANEHFFPVVLYIMLYKVYVVLTFMLV